ncbi:MAG: hypothetical protein K5927_08435 [Lachnospiraceae bacterium]|nr:hypothetical protein [Lachnospiraceae bacterium]
MKVFSDKVIIMLFSALLIMNVFEDNAAVIMLFAMVTATSFTSYLRMLGGKGRKANIIIVTLAGACIVIWPKAAVIIPILAYDAYLDRQIVGGLVLAAGTVRYAMQGETQPLLMLIFLILLALYLSYRSERLEKFETENRRIRDEDEIQKEMLRRQKQDLLDEQDNSISAAQLAERNRIAREIHDNVGHMLSRSILQVGAMMVVHKDDGMAAELKDLRETLDSAMNNIRRSVHDIRDDAIVLSSAIEEIISPLKDSFKVTFEFDADDASISKEVKYAVINIVKEAVSNIIKHSKNENVDIRFYEHPSMYQLVVHDHGGEKMRPEGGVTVSKLGDPGMGLENIRLRAEKLGGNAVFTNENGFRVFVRIPKGGKE